MGACLFAVALLVLSGCGPVQRGPPPDVAEWPGESWAGAPRIERTDCASLGTLTIPEGERADCGYLYVAENRSKAESRTLRLAFAVLRSQYASPAPDPVVILSGGPGLSALQVAWYWFRFPTMENRDFVVLEPRGTGLSDPDMACPELPPEDAAQQARPPSAEERRARTIQWASRCRDRLVGLGADLTAYHTLANVEDLEELRRALGYEQWNLYGVSYGTRWALMAMREHPDGVRSAVLDSAMPPQVGAEGLPAKLADVLDRVFAACQADAACRSAYPDLESVFYGLVEEFDTRPLRITLRDQETGATQQEWFTGADMIGGAFDGLYDPDLVSLLPLAAYQVQAGNRAIIEGLASDADGTPVADGVFYSVNCHEEAPFFDRERFLGEVARYPRLAGFWADHSFREVCDLWGAGQADAAADEAVDSDIPTLILAGEFDPTTPPAFGRLAAATLSRSYVYEFPGLSHVVTLMHPCPQGIMKAFVDQPMAAPDTSCIAQMPGMQFVTDLAPNPGVYRLASSLFLAPDPLPLILAAVCALLLLSAAVGLPVVYLARRRRGALLVPRGLPGLAWLLLWAVAVLNLVFALGLVFLLLRVAERNEYLLLFGVPSAAVGWFVLPWVTAALTIVTLVPAVLAWVKRWWPPIGRLYFAICTLAAVAFGGLLFYWGLPAV